MSRAYSSETKNNFCHIDHNYTTGQVPQKRLLFCNETNQRLHLCQILKFQEKLRLLRNKAVAYLNLDIIVTGHNVLNVAANPVLHDLIYESAKEVSSLLVSSGCRGG